MATPEGPEGLASGGRWLWQQVTEAHELDATQLAQGLDHLIRREGYALADVHRSGLVIDAKREESHAESLIR